MNDDPLAPMASYDELYGDRSNGNGSDEHWQSLGVIDRPAPARTKQPKPKPKPQQELDLLRHVRTGDWLEEQHFDPVRYAVPGLIAEGFTLLAGPPKIGKSWLALQVALACASGGKALGRIQVEQRPVLYLALEDGHRRMQDRCRQLLGPSERIPSGFSYTPTVELGMILPTIEQWLGQYGNEAPLVWLDTLGKVMPLPDYGETTYQRDYRIGGALKALADDCPGTALTTNHHDRKASSDDFVEAVSGTNGLAGAADSIIILCRARQQSGGLVKVTGRDVEEGEYAVNFTRDGKWCLDGDSLESAAAQAEQIRVTAGVGDNSAKIIAFVASHPDGVRSSDVEAALGEDARRYLARLADSGRIQRLSRGLYAPLSHVSQCPEQDAGMGQRDSWDTPNWDSDSPTQHSQHPQHRLLEEDD